jgi:hypothetical protein
LSKQASTWVSMDPVEVGRGGDLPAARGANGQEPGRIRGAAARVPRASVCWVVPAMAGRARERALLKDGDRDRVVV